MLSGNDEPRPSRLPLRTRSVVLSNKIAGLEPEALGGLPPGRNSRVAPTPEAISSELTPTSDSSTDSSRPLLSEPDHWLGAHFFVKVGQTISIRGRIPGVVARAIGIHMDNGTFLATRRRQESSVHHRLQCNLRSIASPRSACVMFGEDFRESVMVHARERLC